MGPISPAGLEQMAAIKAEREQRIADAEAEELADALLTLKVGDHVFLAPDPRGRGVDGYVTWVARDDEEAVEWVRLLSIRMVGDVPVRCDACDRYPGARWEWRSVRAPVEQIVCVVELSGAVSAWERARQCWSALAGAKEPSDSARQVAEFATVLSRLSGPTKPKDA